MSSIDEYWRAVRPDKLPPFIHPADCPLLDEIRPNLASGGYLHLALLPEPYIGDLANADIFILHANPGFGGNEYYEQYGCSSFRERLIATLQQKFEGVDSPHVYLDPKFQTFEGYQWWTRHLSGVAPLEALASSVATLDLFPYHSVQYKFDQQVNRLPSSIAIKEYVHSELVPRARRGEIVLIVGRQGRNWGFKPSDDDGRNLIVYSAGEARGGYMTDRTRGGQAIMEFMHHRPCRSPKRSVPVRTGTSTEPTQLTVPGEREEQADDIDGDIAGDPLRSAAPCMIQVGGIFYLDEHSWHDRVETRASVEHAAQQLMGLNGPDAISALVRAIEELGPMIGSNIIRQGLGLPADGPGSQNWTKLFFYAWKHHGILRYMSGQDGRGYSRYCTLEQAFAHRAD